MSPTGAAALVVAAADAAAVGEFLGHLGFVADGDRWLVPDGAPVAVEVAAGRVAGRAPVDFERGPRALDLYTGDLDAALAAVAAAGYPTSEPATIAAGPLVMRQALVTGPEGLPVVLVESSHRRSSLLDEHPDRLLSEPHSVVWCVDDLDGEAARWQSAGWTAGPVLAFEEPAVSEYLGLPRSPVPIRMTMLSGPDTRPIRLELLEFSSDPGPAGPAWVEALVFVVDDPPTVSAALELDAAGVTPGGIRVELRRG